MINEQVRARIHKVLMQKLNNTKSLGRFDSWYAVLWKLPETIAQPILQFLIINLEIVSIGESACSLPNVRSSRNQILFKFNTLCGLGGTNLNFLSLRAIWGYPERDGETYPAQCQELRTRTRSTIEFQIDGPDHLGKITWQ